MKVQEMDKSGWHLLNERLTSKLDLEVHECKPLSFAGDVYYLAAYVCNALGWGSAPAAHREKTDCIEIARV